MVGGIRFKVLGVAFICLLLAGVWLTYGVFTQKFTSFDEVTLDASTIGLQMPERADVKIRGVIVGEVLGFTATDQGAKVRLGIFPSQLHTIPANVTGAIVPKTLFGEKYVSLVVPDQPSPASLQPGATITRTEVPVEVQKVLGDLYPLLRTVQPADINMTLNAISTALEGRGNQLGNDLVTVDHYLKRVNPQIPQVVADLRLTTRVSNTYADVMPSIAQILRNTVKTTGTLHDRRQQLQTLFSDVTSFSGTAHDFLRQNGDNIIRLGQVSRPQAQLLARYAPEYPCLLGGLVRSGKLEAQAFRGFDAAHRARDPAPPAARLHPGRPARVRRHPWPQLPAPAQSAVEPGQPGAAPAQLQRRGEHPDRQGHGPRGAVVLHPRHRVRRRRRRVGRPQEPARPLARDVCAGRARPRCAAGRADGPWREGVAAMTLLRTTDARRTAGGR